VDGTPSGQRRVPLRSWLCFLIGGLYLLFLWSRNCNLLGETFDYSILTSACAHLRAGLTPYRDFTTPLQSLTIYVCFAAERVFGHRYLALGLANLIIGLAFYSAILACARSRLSLPLQLLAAVALTGSTFFQHGILWYDCLAMMLITLAVWCAALCYRAGRVAPRHFAALGVLLYLSSMCKLNFHLLELAIVLSILSLLYSTTSGADRRRLGWIMAALAVIALVPGPLTEMALNHATPGQFFENVLLAPRSRLGNLGVLGSPRLYFGNIFGFYPDNPVSGIYWKAALLYGAGALWVVLKASAPADHLPQDGKAAPVRRLLPILLAGFMLGSLLLTISNLETEIVTSVFLVTGMVATHFMFAPRLSRAQLRGFELCAAVLCVLFCLYSGIAAVFHSRVRYGEASWTVNVRRAMTREPFLEAVKLRFPFYDAAAISPQLKPYFDGVRFTEVTRQRMERITAFMDTNHLAGRTDTVLWGPGLEILNEVYGNPPRVRLPLWFHLGVTVREQDSPRIIAELQRGDYEWIVAARWMNEMPKGVIAYINTNYDAQGDEDLHFFHKKMPAPAR
jgi:hypothetical protein